MKKFAKRIPLLLLVVTIILIALPAIVGDLSFWPRIFLAAVAIAALIAGYWVQQKSDRGVGQRFEQVQQVATKRDSVRNYEDIFAERQRATQQPPPKGKV